MPHYVPFVHHFKRAERSNCRWACHLDKQMNSLFLSDLKMFGLQLQGIIYCFAAVKCNSSSLFLEVISINASGTCALETIL